jgi:hypothetical protein
MALAVGSGITMAMGGWQTWHFSTAVGWLIFCDVLAYMNMDV